MPRRSTPQPKLDDLAFPVRVKVAVPALGLGKALTDAHTWLKAELGKGEYACHSQPGIACDTAAFYFRSLPAALQFIDAFPDMTLADGTFSPAYGSAAGHRGAK